MFGKRLESSLKDFYNLLSSREMVRDMPSFQKKNLNGSFKVRKIFQKDFTIIESSCKRKRNKTSHTNVTLNLFLSNLICVKFKHVILTRVFTYPLLLINIRTWNAVQIRMKIDILNII